MENKEEENNFTGNSQEDLKRKEKSHQGETYQKNSPETRKETIRKWFSDNNNLIFAGIIILALVIRIYYFSLTANQPLWWDEADYLAYAKNLAGLNSEWIVTAQHQSLFPFIVAAFFVIGFSEVFTKFFVEFIPSIALVALTYFVVGEIYKDKRIALISAFLVAISWTVLFNSMRFHLGVPALIFGFLAIYVFWKGYEKREKIFGKINPNWAIPLTVVMVALTYSIRRGYFLFGFFFLIYMLTTRDIKSLIKDKYNWIGLGIVVVLIGLAETLIFSSGGGGIGGVSGSYINTENPLKILVFDVMSSFFGHGEIPVLLYLFWIGIIISIAYIGIYFGHISKTKDDYVRGDLFFLITIIVTMAFFIFVLRPLNGFGEPRWYFPLLLGAFVCVSRATTVIFDYLKKYGKTISLIFLLVILALGAYMQIQHTDNIIKPKTESFSGIRDASLYLKENSEPSDVIVTLGQPQVSYYSERKTLHAKRMSRDGNNEMNINTLVSNLSRHKDAKYLLITFSEPGYPEWMRSQRVMTTEQGNRVVVYALPFMDSVFAPSTGQREIKEQKTYGNITFNLETIKGDAFVYEIEYGGLNAN